VKDFHKVPFRVMRQHPFITGAVLLLLAGAVIALTILLRKPPKPVADVVLARVGDRVITSRDFLLNYEFGFPHLKTGTGPVARKRSYLHAMVNELLLAQDGIRNGLDRTPRVLDNDTRVQTELLVEELIRVEVVDKTSVPDAEVRDAINRSHVRFKVRYWGEPTPRRALDVRAAMQRDGYMRVADSLRAVHTDIPADPAMFESDYVNAFELDPAVLEAVKDLGPGDISMPVPLNNAFYLFQVIDIRRQGIMEHEYVSKFETMKKVLLNTKYDEGIARYVGGFMTPLGVVTHGAPFWKLCDAVVEWKSSGDHSTRMLRDAVKDHPERTSYAALRAVWNEPLVTYRGGQQTVGQFLDHFWPSLRDVDSVTTAHTRHLLSQQVALTVRDHLLAGEALRRGLDRAPAVEHDRRKWLEKAVYEEVRDVTAARAADPRNAGSVRAMLERLADSLRTTMQVTIDYNILDTLAVDDTPSSRQIGMQLFKLGSKRLAIPATDGIWGGGE
jgi:hypothetical protein